MKRVLMTAALLGLSSAALAQAPTQPAPTDRPCMGDAARLCPGIEPGGGAQLTCLKSHKEELSPACKKKVMQAKVKNMEQKEMQQQQEGK